MSWHGAASLGAFILLVGLPVSARAQADSSRYRPRLITVDRDVRLEVLDWGAPDGRSCSSREENGPRTTLINLDPCSQRITGCTGSPAVALARLVVPIRDTTLTVSATTSWRSSTRCTS